LPSSKQSIWLKGFRAGQALESQLPYPDGTAEAKAWLEGWAQGIHVKGQPPSEPEDSDFEDSEPEAPPSSRWKRLFKTLLGR
jgi:hypothetical protein